MCAHLQVFGSGVSSTRRLSGRTTASRVGSANEVLLAWGIGGVLAALGAFVFAELAARQPGHGGIVRYIHAAFGPLPAFLYGWSN